MVRRKILTAKGEREEEGIDLRWRVTYSDGLIVNQYNSDGTKNSYQGISREYVDSFSLVSPSGKSVVSFKVGDGIFWHRQRVTVLPFGSYTFPHSRRIHLCGLRTRKAGGSIKDKIYVVDVDGKVKEYSKFDKRAFLTEPEWTYAEQI